MFIKKIRLKFYIGLTFEILCFFRKIIIITIVCNGCPEDALQNHLNRINSLKKP